MALHKGIVILHIIGSQDGVSQSLAEQNICLYIGSVSQSLAETGKSNIASIHSGLGEKKTHKHYVFDDISMIFR